MAFQIQNPDNELSPFTGMAREHWVESGKFLLNGVFQHIADLDKPIVMPRQHEITYPQPDDPPWKFRSQEFEGLARTLMLAAPVLKDEPDLTLNGKRVSDYYANQVLRATDPKSPGYLMTLTDIINQHGVRQYQHTVEGAALAIGLMFSRDLIWNKFSRAERDQVAAFISDIAHHRTIGNNWRFFNVLMMTFLKVNGYEIDEAALKDHVQHLMAFYVGNGWYRDDATFDYYNPWGFHFYGPIWCSWYAYEHEPEAATIIEQRHGEFMRTYPRMFARDGRQLMWGRSIIYRCAAAAAFGGAFLLKHTTVEPGLARRIASGNIMQFIGRDNVFLNGVPCLGYYGPFAPLVQFYSCAASPFWLSKAYIALTLPADSPFWTATESEGDWADIGTETRSIFLEGPGILVVNHGTAGTTELLPAKVPKRDPYYAQLAYSTHFPWEAEAPEGATAMTYSIREADENLPFITPLELGFIREEDGIVYRQFNTKPEGLGDPNKGGINKGSEKIDLAEIIVPGGMVRVDRLRLPYKHEIHLGHYGLPRINGIEAKVSRLSAGGCDAITAAIDGRQVALVACHGWDGVDAMVHEKRHAESDRSTVIYAHRRRDKDYRGMDVLVTVLLHKTTDEPWTEQELSVVKQCELLPWTETGSPCGMRITLTNGTTIEIDYREADKSVVH